MTDYRKQVLEAKAAEIMETTAAAIIAHPNAIHTVAMLLRLTAEVEGQAYALAGALNYTTADADRIAAQLEALLS